jgi:XPG I-region
MAYMAHHGDVWAVITEDGDLLPYGCPRVGAPAHLSARLALLSAHPSVGSVLPFSIVQRWSICDTASSASLFPICRCCSSWTRWVRGRRWCWLSWASIGTRALWGSPTRCSWRYEALRPDKSAGQGLAWGTLSQLVDCQVSSLFWRHACCALTLRRCRRHLFCPDAPTLSLPPVLP